MVFDTSGKNYRSVLILIFKQSFSFLSNIVSTPVTFALAFFMPHVYDSYSHIHK